MAEGVNMDKKRCCKCKLEKSPESFSKNRSRKDGMAGQCKACERQFNIYKRKTENKLLALAKHRAKKKNLEFNLELEDVVIPDYCPVLGIKLQRNRGGKAANDNSPSVDRIDNSRGYIKGNIKIISYKANIMKNTSSSKDLKKMIDYIENNKETFLQKIIGVFKRIFRF